MKEMNRLWNYFSEDFTKRETISSYNNTINELRADNAKQERLIRSNLSILLFDMGPIFMVIGFFLINGNRKKRYNRNLAKMTELQQKRGF